jgi:hypothetical protein
MAALRPECKTTSKSATVVGGSAYYAIHAAVEHEDGLIHGKLHEKGAHCAIGSYFATHETAALPSDFIDEVAGVNDAVPWMTPNSGRPSSCGGSSGSSPSSGCRGSVPDNRQGRRQMDDTLKKLGKVFQEDQGRTRLHIAVLTLQRGDLRGAASGQPLGDRGWLSGNQPAMAVGILDPSSTGEAD